MISSIIRILVGLSLVVAAILLFDRNRAQIHNGGKVTVYGMSAGTTSWIPAAYAGVALVGTLLVAAGVRGLWRTGK